MQILRKKKKKLYRKSYQTCKSIRYKTKAMNIQLLHTVARMIIYYQYLVMEYHLKLDVDPRRDDDASPMSH